METDFGGRLNVICIEVQMSGNQPSLVSLNNRLGLYTKGCYLKRAENAFRDIEVRSLFLNDVQKYGKKPDVFSYYEIITMYSKTKHLKEAASMMREMQLKGLTPSADTYGEIVYLMFLYEYQVLGLSRVGDVNTALAVMTDIKRQGLPFPKERYLRPLRLHLHVLVVCNLLTRKCSWMIIPPCLKMKSAFVERSTMTLCERMEEDRTRRSFMLLMPNKC